MLRVGQVTIDPGNMGQRKGTELIDLSLDLSDLSDPELSINTIFRNIWMVKSKKITSPFALLLKVTELGWSSCDSLCDSLYDSCDSLYDGFVTEGHGARVEQLLQLV